MERQDFTSGWIYHRNGDEVLSQAVTLPHDAMLHSPRSRGKPAPWLCTWGPLGAWGKVLGRQSLGCEVAASADLPLLSVQAASPHRPPQDC